MACSHATDDKKDSKKDGKAQIEIWGGLLSQSFLPNILLVSDEIKD